MDILLVRTAVPPKPKFTREEIVADECMSAIQKDYGLSYEATKTLFEHTWIHTYGIGTLCATGMCKASLY